MAITKKKSYGKKKRVSRGRSKKNMRKGYSKSFNKIGSSTDLTYKFVRQTSFAINGFYRLQIDNQVGFVMYGVGATGVIVAQSANLGFVFTLSGVNLYFNGSYQGQLGLPNYTEFTNLFDQFMIDYVEIRPVFGSNMSSTTSQTNLPTLYWVKDYNDANALTLADIAQVDNVHMARLDKVPVIRVQPKFQGLAYNTVATSGYTPKRSYLLTSDTYSKNVSHYGVKMVLDTYNQNFANNNIGCLEFNFTYHLKLKGVK